MAGRYRRSETRLRWDDLDHILICLPLTGSVLLGGAAGTLGRLRPHDIGILDLAAPADIRIRHSEAISLILPRTALPAGLVGSSPQPARVLGRDTALGRILGRFLVGLATEATRLAKSEGMALASALPSVIACCLGTGRPQPEGAGEAALKRRLHAHIEKNLHLPTLGPAMLMADLHLSRSQLYRQFEAVGGVSHYIRRRRLRRCLLTLRDPLHADRRIGEVAYDMGFADEAHFSRLFREAFGVSPRTVRAAARGGGTAVPPAPIPPPSRTPCFADWVAGLTGW